jgi:hypothetical protein
MQLFNLSLTSLLFILFGIVALFTLIVGIRMPGKFSEEEKIRNDLKKKIYDAEIGDQDDDQEEDDKNQVS